MVAKWYSGNNGGLKLLDICLTGKEKPRENLTQETCPDRGLNPGPLRDRRACYRLLHSEGLYICYIHTYVQDVPKSPTSFRMLCRTTNWSLFKKEPLSGNKRFVCCRASKFDNERVSKCFPISFGVLSQQVFNPLATCGLYINMWNQFNVTYPNQWIGRGD